MATLTLNVVARAGVTVSLASAAVGGDEFVNTGQEFFMITNGGGSINVTISTPNSVDGNAIADLVVVVGAGVTMFIGPFPKGTYNDSANKVQITYSGVTTVTVGVFRVVSFL